MTSSPYIKYQRWADLWHAGALQTHPHTPSPPPVPMGTLSRSDTHSMLQCFNKMVLCANPRFLLIMWVRTDQRTFLIPLLLTSNLTPFEIHPRFFGVRYSTAQTSYLELERDKNRYSEKQKQAILPCLHTSIGRQIVTQYEPNCI